MSPGAPRRSSRTAASRSEEGSITLFLAISAVGLLVLAGLAVDGGAKVRAVQRADRIAAEAARAAAQALDIAAVRSGEGIAVDRRAAVRAAHEYLASAGVEGSASLAGGARLTVVTHTSTPTVFLSLVGVAQLRVSGRADVVLVHDIGGAP